LKNELQKVVEAYLPGLPVNEELLLELFHNQSDKDHIVLHREDIPENVELSSALEDLYGAEEGDLIFRISTGPQLNQPRIARVERTKMAA
jgi:hypothetical protein